MRSKVPDLLESVRRSVGWWNLHYCGLPCSGVRFGWMSAVLARQQDLRWPLTFAGLPGDFFVRPWDDREAQYHSLAAQPLVGEVTESARAHTYRSGCSASMAVSVCSEVWCRFKSAFGSWKGI